MNILKFDSTISLFNINHLYPDTSVCVTCNGLLKEVQAEGGVPEDKQHDRMNDKQGEEARAKAVQVLTPFWSMTWEIEFVLRMEDSIVTSVHSSLNLL